MFDTSKDILNLVIGISILSLAFFLSWSLYYLVLSLRNVFRLTKRVEVAIKKVEDLAETIKSKVKNAGSYLFVASELVKKVMKMMNNKKETDWSEDEERTKKKTKKKKK